MPNWPDVAATSFLTFVLLIICGYLLRPFLDSYLKEKGKNLATKEDLHILNSQIEQVKQSFMERNAYLSEKGKNAASKEDIAELTEKIEAVKTYYSSSLEYLKNELNKDITLHRLAAEKEFQTLTEMAEALINLKLSASKASPFNIIDNPDDSEFSIKKENVTSFAKAVDAFHFCLQKNKLFLSTSIYNQLFEILLFCAKEIFPSGNFLNMKDDLSIKDKILITKDFYLNLEKVTDNAISSIHKRFKLDIQ